MKLHRLRLVNFRQHADTEIAFGDGITGIIGPNGSGKTSLLEAIAWAIYGNQAARGDKDSIRNLRAKARASVRVELEFGLGSHSFRVERGLNNAELYQDGVVVANSLKEVTGRLQRVLGMTHAEFFNTYFTGQKELAVLADATRPERAAFLSRVLRHEQLTIAQERVRERRNALGHEVDGLETGLPPQAELEKERKVAETRLAGARRPRRRRRPSGARRSRRSRRKSRAGSSGWSAASAPSPCMATCVSRSRVWWLRGRSFSASTRSWRKHWRRARSCANSMRTSRPSRSSRRSSPSWSGCTARTRRAARSRRSSPSRSEE